MGIVQFSNGQPMPGYHIDACGFPPKSDPGCLIVHFLSADRRRKRQNILTHIPEITAILVDPSSQTEDSETSEGLSDILAIFKQVWRNSCATDWEAPAIFNQI